MVNYSDVNSVAFANHKRDSVNLSILKRGSLSTDTPRSPSHVHLSSSCTSSQHVRLAETKLCQLTAGAAASDVWETLHCALELHAGAPDSSIYHIPVQSASQQHVVIEFKTTDGPSGGFTCGCCVRSPPA